MDAWLFFGLFTPLCWGFSNVLDSLIRRHYVKDDMAATWFLAITRLPVIVAFFLIWGIEIPNTLAVSMMILGGLVWMAPFIFYFKAMEFEEPSRVGLFLQTLPIFTLVFSYLLINEQLTTSQWIAFIPLIFAGIFAAIKPTESKFRISAALPIIALASAIWALSDVLFKKFEPAFSVFFTAFSFYFLGSFLISFIMLLVPHVREKIKESYTTLTRRGWFLFGIDQVVGITGSLAFSYALSMGKASLTTVLIGIQPLFAFFFALILKPLIPEVSPEGVDKKSLIFKGLSLACIIIGLLLLEK